MEHWEILARLYNHAKPLGYGFLHYNPKPMSESEAKNILKARDRPDLPFNPDYLNGRVMKIEIVDVEKLKPLSYERDNGVGSAMKALTCPGCHACLT